MAESLLCVSGLTKRFYRSGQPVYALREVSFSLKRGEFVAVMGASGSGKTTLLQVIAGLATATEGFVQVGGAFLHAYTEEQLAHYRQTQVGYTFQFFNLMPSLTVLENVALPLIIGNTPRRTALERARETLDLLQLEVRGDAAIETLSGGEMQRLALARALVHRPGLLLADEPTASLDSLEADWLLELLQGLKASWGLSILMVTHNARVAAHAERMVTLREGVLKDLQEGPHVFA